MTTFMPSDRPLKLFFDGGCRPNPGRIETAVVARGTAHFNDALGSGTNNDAEWLALLEAVALGHRLGAQDVIFVGDSAMVIAQASGAAPCRSAALQAHLDAFRAAIRPFARVRLRRVGRHRNLAGIALESRRSGTLAQPCAPPAANRTSATSPPSSRLVSVSTAP